jgi:hypothetical protein
VTLSSFNIVTMKIIALSHPQDDHAAPVVWALEQAGCQAACLSGISEREEEQASLLLDQGQPPAITLGVHTLERGDVVWHRQPPEHSPAQAEARALAGFVFLDSLARMLEALPARCVNNYSASCLVRNKGVQLYLARRSGLKVPATLLSNSAPAVRAFFDQHPDNAICKAFASHVWQQQGSNDVMITETFPLTREQLPDDDEVFTYAPAIYQQRVAKQADVRMVLMGEQIYSYALQTPGNALDWRHPAAFKDARVELVPTPADVQSGILRFARETGICFGSADFAIDRDGAWWFLEINEQGQFLWLDHLCPEGRLLEKFCAFLTAPQGAAQPVETRQELFPSLAEYRRSNKNVETLSVLTMSAESPYKSAEP